MPTQSRTSPTDAGAQFEEARRNMGLIARIADNAHSFFSMLGDKNYTMPSSAKFKLLLCVLYVISPIDIVPDVFPILGWIDDGFMLGWFCKIVADVVADYRAWKAARAAADAPRVAGRVIEAKPVEVRVHERETPRP